MITSHNYYLGEEDRLEATRTVRRPRQQRRYEALLPALGVGSKAKSGSQMKCHSTFSVLTTAFIGGFGLATQRVTQQ